MGAPSWGPSWGRARGWSGPRKSSVVAASEEHVELSSPEPSSAAQPGLETRSPIDRWVVRSTGDRLVLGLVSEGAVPWVQADKVRTDKLLLWFQDLLLWPESCFHMNICF